MTRRPRRVQYRTGEQRPPTRYRQIRISETIAFWTPLAAPKMVGDSLIAVELPRPGSDCVQTASTCAIGGRSYDGVFSVAIPRLFVVLQPPPIHLLSLSLTSYPSVSSQLYLQPQNRPSQNLSLDNYVNSHSQRAAGGCRRGAGRRLRRWLYRDQDERYRKTNHTNILIDATPTSCSFSQAFTTKFEHLQRILNPHFFSTVQHTL